MGTRNLTCIIKDNEYKIAKYGQWDGCIGGVGKDLLEAFQPILINNQLDVLINKIRLTKEPDENEFRAAVLSCGGKEEDDLELTLSMDASDVFKSNFPSLHRDTSGAELVTLLIESNEPLLVSNSLDFASDSLFCEWCYVIDLDKEVFEIYKGFNEEALSENERFYFLQEKGKKYSPVKFFTSLSFEDIKKKEMSDIIEDLLKLEREYYGEEDDI